MYYREICNNKECRPTTALVHLLNVIYGFKLGAGQSSDQSTHDGERMYNLKSGKAETRGLKFPDMNISWHQNRSAG